MRNVTKTMCSAFRARVPRRVSNDRTDGNVWQLHGNVIAEWQGDGVCITDAGWRTNTTKERLNGILASLVKGGAGITQRRGVWFYQDERGCTLWEGHLFIPADSLRL